MKMRMVDVKALRLRLELSQNQFARRYGFNITTLRQWEQGRRSPDMAARTLLAVIDRSPGVVSEALKSA